MNKEKDLINVVLERAQGVNGKKKLACVKAFELAREFETKTIEIGRICNRYNIKICKCQLGCFR